MGRLVRFSMLACVVAVGCGGGNGDGGDGGPSDDASDEGDGPPITLDGGDGGGDDGGGDDGGGDDGGGDDGGGDTSPSECTVGEACRLGTCRDIAHECQMEIAAAIGEEDDPIDGHEDAIAVKYFEGGYCTPARLRQFGTDTAACNPDDTESCGTCATCLTVTADNGTMCFRTCEPSETEQPCPGTRQYCDWNSGACIPFGCESNDECAVYRPDTNENDEIDPVSPENPEGDHLVYDTDGMWTCNETTDRCEHPGAEGAKAGDDCVKDSDCEENGECLGPTSAWDGYCIKFGCGFAGRECEGQDETTVCQERRIGAEICLKGCTVAELENPEGGETGAVRYKNPNCDEGFACLWNGTGGPGAELNGACVPSEFNEVEPNVGAACEDDTDCWSPYGEGRCLTGGVWGPDNYCTVLDCAAPGLDDIDPDTDGSQNVCGDGNQCVTLVDDIAVCVNNCETAADCNTNHACIDYYELGTKHCFPVCREDGDCKDGESCNIATGAAEGLCE